MYADKTGYIEENGNLQNGNILIKQFYSSQKHHLISLNHDN